MKEYSPEILKRIQNVELEIYKYFSDVCRKNEINYFAVGGTNIGAVRHNGFIPWDDDMDIGLLRKDYDKLIRILKDNIDERYEVINTEININFPLMVTRIQKKGTSFKDFSLKDVKCDLGIYIDLFPFDCTSPNQKEQRRHIKKSWFWGKMLILRSLPYPVIPYKKGFKAGIVKYTCLCLHYLLCLFHISPKYIYKKAYQSCVSYNSQNTNHFLCLMETFPSKSLMTLDSILPTKTVKFEDTTMEVFCNYDRYLSNVFGDYMKLPLPEDRKNHYPSLLDFGKSK